MNIFRRLSLLLILSMFAGPIFAQRSGWMPTSGKLLTSWAKNIDPDHIHDEYPRPTLVRKEWKNLNGMWQFTVTDKDAPRPDKYDGNILVPFPVESALSGVGIRIDQDHKIWYKRKFFVPDSWSYRYILLHIGASDWETTVYINGKEIGQHRGGYDPFTFDISFYLKEKGMQEMEISVWDPTDQYHQPRGKQSSNPKGIWYTPVSGIWQTIWIEPVNWAAIKDLKITPDIDHQKVHFNFENYNAMPKDSIKLQILDDTQIVSQFSSPAEKNFAIDLPQAKLWSPDHPFLYKVHVKLVRSDSVIDQISSYFGMRKVEVKNDKHGIKRIFLNNQPIFELGLLDQGWWPGGLYTAPDYKALVYDIDQAKNMGFNLIRKHVKVEPAVWYAHCDRAGMLVWQDMPNSDKNAEWKGPSGIDGVEINREFISEAQYKLEFGEIIKDLYNFPCIVNWIPFNEGWGQFKTVEITNWVKTEDSTRLVGGPSGGNYFPVGDTRDFHQYPGPGIPPGDPNRALVLGEFGGLGLPVKGHLWQDKENWGYRKFKKPKDLENAYLQLIEKLKPLINEGLCAAVYTQTTDVEGEVNGLTTYDREVLKFNPKKVRKANEEIYDYFQSLEKKK